MIKAIIVDDEQAPREVLQELIAGFCPQVELIGEAENTSEAYSLIQHKDPDLVFMDIEMPNKSGVSFLNELPEINFDIIFTTAHVKYALQAIKLSAIDYLVKPIQINELVKAVDKVSSVKNSTDRTRNFVENQQSATKKIALSHSKGVDFIELDDINYCKAEGSYTRFCRLTGPDIVISKPLREYDELLPDDQFFRCHKSYLVNIHHIEKINRENYVILRAGHHVQVARSKKEALIRLIAGHQ